MGGATDERCMHVSLPRLLASPIWNLGKNTFGEDTEPLQIPVVSRPTKGMVHVLENFKMFVREH